MEHPCGAVIGPVNRFLEKLLKKTGDLGIDISGREIDHICYRCCSAEEYKQISNGLLTYSELLVESMIGGRPISIFRLFNPIVLGSSQIRCLEIASPKSGRSHHFGLEHAEIVIGEPTDTMFDNEDQLLQFQARYPEVQFDCKAIKKHVNADISIDLGEMSVKFHMRPLDEVVAEEIRLGLVELVPEGYFN